VTLRIRGERSRVSRESWAIRQSWHDAREIKELHRYRFDTGIPLVVDLVH
jgi:hypothetical protein